MFKKIIEETIRGLGLAVLIVIAMFVIKAADLDLGTIASDKDGEYVVGQVWQYQTRSGEEKSTLQIIGISKYPDEEAIIHISVRGLIMKNPMTESGISEEIGHLAFSRTAFSESVSTLLGMSELSEDAKKAPKEWRSTYETEGGGVFRVGISELIELTEAGMGAEWLK